MTAIICLALLNIVTIALFALFVWKVYLPLSNASLAAVNPSVAQYLENEKPALTVKTTMNEDELLAQQKEWVRLVMQGHATDEEAAPFLDEEMHPKS